MLFCNFFCLGILVLLLNACSIIKPESPQIIVQEYVQPTQDVSTIYVPLTVNLEPIFAKVEQDTPKKMTGAENQCEGVSFSYRFERNPIQFFGKNDFLSFSVDGKYALKVNYCPKCSDFFQTAGTNCIIPRVFLSCGEGEPMRRIRLGFDTKLSVSSDYKIQSKTSLAFVKAIDPCEVSFVNYDASEEVLKEVEKSLKDLAKDLDKQIQATQIRQELDAAWSILCKPISLGTYGFLLIQPQKVYLSEPVFYQKQLKIDAGLEAFPFISTHKPVSDQKPLPSLSKLSKEKGFSINLDLISSYDSLNRMLEKNLHGLELDFKGRKFHIDRVAVYGATKEKLQFEVDFSGAKSGKLFLVGTPTFDNQTATISFKDVDFDIQTKDVLLKSAKWLFSNRITKLIEEKAKYSFGNEIDNIKKKLNLEINKSLTKDIKLEGNCKSIELIQIFPTDNQLLVKIKFVGNLNVHIF